MKPTDKPPKGWHIAKGKELEEAKAQMGKHGFMYARRSTYPIDPRHQYEIWVKDKES